VQAVARRVVATLCVGFALALLALGAAAPRAADAQAPAGANGATGAGAVTVLDVNGAIGPATSHYIEKGIAAADTRGSTLVILKMDTPGGLDTSMRDIIRAILGSKVPVATYVAPSGARAASAGTYIMYASHIAAMAPATNIGAATPVSIGGEPPPEKPAGGSGASPNDDDSAQPEGSAQGKGDQAERGEKSGKPDNATPSEPRAAPKSQSGAPSGESSGGKSGGDSARNRARTPPEPASAMERKVINDAVAYIRGLAELRGRDADWAEEAVRSAASLSATAALQRNVIDVIARDIPDLLDQIDGREVKVVGNKVVKLATRGRAVEHIAPDWRTKLLSVITNPTIAYGLLLIGIYGLLFEGYNPGAILPGVVGAIALITALFAFQVLDVNYAGLALIGLGIAMIIGEFFVPSFGALGVGGLVAFVVGSIILLDTDTPGLNIGMPIIGAVATFGGLVIVAIAYMARRSMKRPVVTGVQAMIGATAEVFQDFVGTGTVRFGGELWNAISEVPLRKGQLVRITRVEGLRVWVEPL
jgi:membrane-bound serine protease (ClpP class)